MSAYDLTFLLERINELERRVDREQRRLYAAKRSRDRWRDRAKALTADARSWRRWKASA
jgi:hypothetical protein